MKTKSINRYILLLIASCVNFVHGCAYIWTVFQPYVRDEYGLDRADSSQPFTLIIGTFAIGNIIGGKLQHKLGARAGVLLGSFVMCLGFALTASAPLDSPFLLSVGYGVLGGLGSGCAFSILVAVPQAWFPDKRGLVTGITIGVIGLSGIIMNPICDGLLEHYGFRIAMLIVTIFYTAICFTGGWFIVEPPQGYMELEGSESAGGSSDLISLSVASVKQFSPMEMLRTKSYYFIALSMALAVPAYILINPLMKSLGMERGLSNATALVGVLAASIMNTAGRFAAPFASDRLGRKQMLIFLYIITMTSIVGLVLAKGGLFIVLISLVSFTYGGFVGVYPAITADYFGIKYQAMNFGVVMLLYGVTSMLCPYIMKAVEQSRYGTDFSFLIAGAFCVIGIVSTVLIKKPDI